MVSRFSSRRKKKEEQKVRALHGMAVKYVVERKDSEEIVLGRGGSVSVREGELLIFSSSEIVFRADIRSLTVAELLSGDGTVIEGTDAADGKHRCLVVYYVYHRK